MASVTFAVDNELRPRIKKFSWINWSELAKEEIIEREKSLEQLKRFKEIVSKSKLTTKDAKELADKISRSMHESLVKEGLI